MTPADELMAPLENTVALGVPKFVWFKTLKNSARNCSCVCSRMRVSLSRDISRLAKPGTAVNTTAHIAIGAKRRQDKGVRIEPLSSFTKDDRAGKRWIERRPVGIAGIAVAGTIRAHLRGEWESTQHGGDAVCLPTSQCVARRPAPVWNGSS